MPTLLLTCAYLLVNNKYSAGRRNLLIFSQLLFDTEKKLKKDLFHETYSSLENFKYFVIFYLRPNTSLRGF